MRHAVRWTITGCLALGAAGAWAHEKPGEPDPNPAMKRLGFLVGKFQRKQKVSLPGGQAIERTVTEEGTWMNGGHQLRLISPNEGLGSVEIILGYDPIAQEYHGWAFTNLAGMPGHWSGTFQDDRLILNGQRLTNRATLGTRGGSSTLTGGYQIDGIAPGGGAEAAGLKTGDLILRIDGKPFAWDLLTGQPDTRARVTFRRGDQEREVEVTRRASPEVGRRMIYQAQPNGGFVVTGETQRDGRWEESGETVYTPLSR
jgi:hypothetical protein